MIRFLPDFETETNQQRKQELMMLCEGFTKENINTACERHANYENVVQIGVGQSIGFKIIDACCSDFRQKLMKEFGESLYGDNK